MVAIRLWLVCETNPDWTELMRDSRRIWIASWVCSPLRVREGMRCV